MNGASRTRYSTGAMWFHWIIAVAVIVNWRLAEAAEHLEGADKAWWMGHHKAVGIAILVLTIGRLIWRWSHPTPPLASTLKTWERMLAKTIHTVFYVMLIGLPLGGWLGVSYFGGGIDMWGLFTVSGLPVVENPEAGKSLIGLHKTGGKIMLILIGLHVLGALKHTLIDKDGNIWRMLPGGASKL